MDESFDDRYPNIDWWTQSGRGWIELGRDEYSSSMIRVLDIGGMLGGGGDEYDSITEAMKGADEFIGQWRIENGYAPE